MKVKMIIIKKILRFLMKIQKRKKLLVIITKRKIIWIMIFKMEKVLILIKMRRLKRQIQENISLKNKLMFSMLEREINYLTSNNF